MKRPELTAVKLSSLKDNDQFLYPRESQIYGIDIEWLTAMVEVADDGDMLVYEPNGVVGLPEEYPEVVLKIG